ncbi:MAG TPA: glutamate synthase subunit alpha, partial [bacterium]|nr:glutamate synthase subunit alpha [bacterium]
MTPAERDSCGVGFIADISGKPTHSILRDAMCAVASMRHRGALAADAKTGDGAGVLTQIPYGLLRRDIPIQAADHDLAVGMIFMPQDSRERELAAGVIEAAIIQTELRPVGWRNVPVNPDALGPHARSTQPFISQVICARPDGWDDAAFDRALYLCRRRIERRSDEVEGPLYIASMSRRTIVYKGLFSSPQLPRFYPDLEDPAFETALAVFHQRYSTNTFPSWLLAQPFRFLAHNGEINTLQGNVSWMQAREATLAPELLPIIQPGGSDSAMLDNVL